MDKTRTGIESPDQERPRPRITRTFTFRGAQPSDVLQAAGACIAEREYGSIVSLTWHGDVADEPSSPLWQMEMTVQAPD